MKALLALPLLLLLSTPLCSPQATGIRGDALEKSCLQQPLDCDDIYAQGYQADGVYLIYPSGPSVPVPVFCDMTTEGGKWTVFQKRFNGSVSFFRGWNDYKLGFGRADGEYWLGLQNLHLLTLKQKYELRVDLEDFENNTAYAKYVDFSISPNAVSAEEDGYTLYVAGFEDGGAGRATAGSKPAPASSCLGPESSCPGPAPRQPCEGAAVSLHCRRPSIQQTSNSGRVPPSHQDATSLDFPYTVTCHCHQPLPPSTGISDVPQQPHPSSLCQVIP
ncbi:microfibril-associated glycoprotein 4 isoform X1 [Heterocephalus glaber]|uniref:Microfibril-associated glycoprotein 4 isoform X1 n=1 Tax=Heterocephalus glaber TaxID=10181 RepID=A0AAX6S2K9_HETGA|nr:microfibril-associated glycoprotein 4 isoform X1 [Heterocephalus glaber]